MSNSIIDAQNDYLAFREITDYGGLPVFNPSEAMDHKLRYESREFLPCPSLFYAIDYNSLPSSKEEELNEVIGLFTLKDIGSWPMPPAPPWFINQGWLIPTGRMSEAERHVLRRALDENYGVYVPPIRNRRGFQLWEEGTMAPDKPHCPYCESVIGGHKWVKTCLSCIIKGKPSVDIKMHPEGSIVVEMTNSKPTKTCANCDKPIVPGKGGVVVVSHSIKLWTCSKECTENIVTLLNLLNNEKATRTSQEGPGGAVVAEGAQPPPFCKWAPEAKCIYPDCRCPHSILSAFCHTCMNANEFCTCTNKKEGPDHP